MFIRDPVTHKRYFCLHFRDHDNADETIISFSSRQFCFSCRKENLTFLGLTPMVFKDKKSYNYQECAQWYAFLLVDEDGVPIMSEHQGNISFTIARVHPVGYDGSLLFEEEKICLESAFFEALKYNIGAYRVKYRKQVQLLIENLDKVFPECQLKKTIDTANVSAISLLLPFRHICLYKENNLYRKIVDDGFGWLLVRSGLDEYKLPTIKKHLEKIAPVLDQLNGLKFSELPAFIQKLILDSKNDELITLKLYNMGFKKEIQLKKFKKLFTRFNALNFGRWQCFSLKLEPLYTIDEILDFLNGSRIKKSGEKVSMPTLIDVLTNSFLKLPDAEVYKIMQGPGQYTFEYWEELSEEIKEKETNRKKQQIQKVWEKSLSTFNSRLPKKILSIPIRCISSFSDLTKDEQEALFHSNYYPSGKCAILEIGIENPSMVKTYMQKQIEKILVIADLDKLNYVLIPVTPFFVTPFPPEGFSNLINNAQVEIDLLNQAIYNNIYLPYIKTQLPL